MLSGVGIFLIFLLGVGAGHLHGRHWERREQRGPSGRGLPFSEQLKSKRSL